VFLSALLIIFVFLAFAFEDPASEREASELATPAHAARQKNLGHMAFLSIAVQTVT
jgi:hypothetical protein